MISVQSKKIKVEELESVRGIAALLVVLYHLPNWNPFIHYLPIVRGAGFMVDLFFVLSGFVIFTAYHNRLQSWIDILRFQFLRLGRLYPVHLLMLAIYLMIETLKYILQTKFGIASVSKPPFVENNLAAFLREFFLIKAFWPNETAMAFNSPAWSISAEFYTYMIFAVIVVYLNKFKSMIFGLISLFCIGVLFLYQPENYNFMLRCLAGFFSGCATFILIKPYYHSNCTKLAPWFTLFAIAMIVYITNNATGFYGIGLLIYPASALLISGIVLSDKSFINALLAQKWLIWLGTISYSLYMSHGAVLWFFNQIVRLILHRQEVVMNGVSTPQFGMLESILLSFSYLFVSVSVAYLIYSWVESPARIKSRELARSI